MIRDALEKILHQQEMSFSKTECDPEYMRLFLTPAVVRETEVAWIVSCRHILKPPAKPAEIVWTETELGYELPEELDEFLSITNGAQLYKVPGAWIPDWVRQAEPEAGYVRYHLFSTLELIKINREMLETFRHFARLDPAYRNIHTLNYVAFCNAHDGNYLAILREGPEQGKVFFLDHEYEFFPYDESTIEAYYTIAESLEAWLELVAKTKGWGGFGRGVPPL